MDLKQHLSKMYPKEYQTWRNICYSNRGSYCNEWHSFKAFIDDVGPAPTKKHMLKRTDVSSPWEASNVKWTKRRAVPDDIRCNLLTFIAMLPKPSSRHTIYKCICDCGNFVKIRRTDFINKKALSCGCMLGSPTHRDTGSKEYKCWRGIIDRCTNPANKSYTNYGGRGIIMADEWRHSYVAFLDHVGRAPTKLHSLDRIDNNRGYEPGNLRWTTSYEQTINRNCRGGLTCDASNCLHAIGIIVLLLKLCQIE